MYVFAYTCCFHDESLVTVYEIIKYGQWYLDFLSEGHMALNVKFICVAEFDYSTYTYRHMYPYIVWMDLKEGAISLFSGTTWWISKRWGSETAHYTSWCQCFESSLKPKFHWSSFLITSVWQMLRRNLWLFMRKSGVSYMLWGC